MRLNGIKIATEPKEILHEIFCLFPDLPYRSKDALVELYTGAFELTIETIKDQKGGKYTRFINSSRKRIQTFTGSTQERDRMWVLERIYDEILRLEGMGTLPGFGFANKFGDKLPGNSERQSIYTKEDLFPKKVERWHNKHGNQNSKIINKPFEDLNQQEEKEMTALKRSQLVKAAKELNKALGLDPQIDTKPGKNNKYLQDMIVEAGSVIEPNDEFSEETWTVLETLHAAVRSADEDEEQEEPEAEGEEEAPEATQDDEGEQEESEAEQEEPEESEPKKPAKKTKSAGTTGTTGTKKKSSAIERTAFGSKKGSSAAAIDEAIIALKGATVSEITEKAGCKKSRANSHVRSLLTKGKITQEKKDGKTYYKPVEE